MQPNASKTRGRGAFRVVEFENPSGAIAHRVTGWTLDGRRIRENYVTHGEAVARLGELEIQSANLETAARPVLTRLSADQIAIAESAFAQLAERPLLDAVRYYLDNYREPVRKISLSDAFDKFIAERTAANLRPLSIHNLKVKCNELITRCGKRDVAQVTADTIREIIFKASRGPKALDNHRRALSSFFTWAGEHGFCASNPVALIKPIKAERHEPAILTPEQAEKLILAAKAHKAGILVPYVALAMFAGLRPAELARLDWQRIDLDAKTIIVGAEIAKMRGRRIVEMEDNLVEWLRPFAKHRQPIVGENWRRDFDAIKEAAGWGTATPENPDLKPWPQDLMRHSAISYHLSKHQHEGKTAQWAGNSPDIIQRHYKGLVQPAETVRFWSIVPKVPKGKIIKAIIKGNLAA